MKQIAYQKGLMDLCIKRERTSEIEMLKKLIEAETVSTTKSATQARDKFSEEITAEVKAEKKRNTLLHQEPGKIKV